MKPKLFTLRNSVLLFFAAFFIAGLLMFRGMGLSWDEELNRIGTALPEYNYVVHGDQAALLESSEKYHGPAFELLLLSAERLFGVSDTRPIYFLRHFITFFFFWLSSVFLYRLGLKLFTSRATAFVVVLMYVMSPRIFGESFYNSKDLGFLSFFTISLYTLYRFLDRRNWQGAFWHALVTGFMIDIRITGLLMPAVTVAAWFVEFLWSRNGKTILWKGLLVIGAYAVLQFFFVVLFWPVLWMGPLHHLSEAFRQMSDYPWRGQMLFTGQIITSESIPWYYLPVWIGVTVPLAYILLFIAGSLIVLRGILKRKNFVTTQGRFRAIALIFTVLPILLVIGMHSVIYDGWRHLYFVYSPFVLVGGIAVEWFYARFPTGLLKQFFTVILSLQFVKVAFGIALDHPHEHVYFNMFAQSWYRPVVEKFDADYWGLSYRAGLEKILAMDTSSAIHIRVENDPGIFNLQMLKPEQRKRFNVHGDIHEVDYWLAEFRGRKIRADDIPLEKAFQIENSSGVLLTCYKGLRSQTKRQQLYYQVLDFEDATANPAFSTTAAAGKYSYAMSPFREMSPPLSYVALQDSAGSVLEAGMEAKVRASAYNPRLVVVLSVMRGDSSIFWQSESFQNLINSTDRWINVKWNVTFPGKLIGEGDRITAYAWNIDKTELLLDDFSMRVERYFRPVGSPYGY